MAITDTTSRLVTNLDGSVTEIAPEKCPNGHELRYPNVIVAHWPRPGTGKLVRAWYCKTCKTTIYDNPSPPSSSHRPGT